MEHKEICALLADVNKTRKKEEAMVIYNQRLAKLSA